MIISVNSEVCSATTKYFHCSHV